MGIFDFFKNNKNKKSNTNNQERDFDDNEYKSVNRGYTITIDGIRKDVAIQHRNKERTNLLLAKAIKTRDGDAIIFDMMDDIAFELKEWQQPTHEVLQAVAYQYERQKELKNEVCNYLGIVDYTQNGYELTQKSLKIEEYVKQQIVPQILRQKEEQRRQADERYMQRQQEERESFMKNLDSRDYVKEMENVKQQRIQNPYLHMVDKYRVNGDIAEDYDGINIKTGEILRVRQLEEMINGDKTGEYMYQGYVNFVENEDDAQMYDNGKILGAVPVCFRLPQRFSDIVQEQNNRKINSVLNLLSNAKNYSDRELIYLGEVDKNWQVDLEKASRPNQNKADQLR